MTYRNHKFHTGGHGGYESSDAILEAIEALAGCELPVESLDADSDNQDAASRIWADPTAAESRAVIAAAWALETDPEEAELNWGQTVIVRPQPAAA